MRTLSTALFTGLLLLVSSLPARSDDGSPGPNRGRTGVEVLGTHLRAEAWAVARGHEVESVVVGRLLPKDGGPVVETYERWSLDGKKQTDRGSPALGKAWEKLLLRALDEAEAEARPAAGHAHSGKIPPSAHHPRRADLLSRLEATCGRSGTRVVGGWAFSWSLGHALHQDGAGRSVARTAVLTFTPAPPPAPASGPEATPRGDRPRGPVTPDGDGATPETGPFPGLGGLPGLSRRDGAAAASGHASASSGGDGATCHAVTEIDLSASAAPPPRPTAPSEPEVTPRAR